MYQWRALVIPLLFSATSTAFRQSILSRRSSSLLSRAMSSAPVEVVPGRPTWQQTMLRIKDPQSSIKFYESLGFTLIDSFDFPQYKFSLYFMTTLAQGETYTLKPGTAAAHDYLWSMEGTALELTHVSPHATAAPPCVSCLTFVGCLPTSCLSRICL
jgi:lactoylglutathione lyase